MRDTPGINTRWVKLYFTLWWDEDHRHYGCPVQASVHTKRRFWVVRPFSGTQTYDWKTQRWTDKWRWIASSPENPNIWARLERQRKGSAA